MQRIYLTDISKIEDEVFDRLMKLLPSDRRGRASKIRKESERKLSVAAGVLLSAALSDYVRGSRDEAICFVQLDEVKTEELCAIAETETESGDHGKPYLKKYPELFFNLSHSGSVAFLVWADVPVGCDVQVVRSCSERLVQKACSPSEKQYVLSAEGEERDLRFSRIWCLKESVLKAVGIGIGTRLSEIETVDEQGNLYENADWFEEEWELSEIELLPGYCFGICKRL